MIEAPGPSLTKRAALILSGGFVLMIAHAFLPIEQFIHRGDDAFYYFKIAANFPDTGMWSLDRIHPTTGVQPLWAIILTAVAQVLHWAGITDLDTLSRVFVALTAVINFASAMLLYRLCVRRVSAPTAVVAAGTFLFASRVVWLRVWGMENSLYALLLIATVSYFHLSFLEQSSKKRAFVLGLLLGLTALARLNAGVLVPCLMLYFVWRCTERPIKERLRLMVVTGVVVTALIVPYLALNYVHSGHMLPISGVAKTVETEHFLEAQGIESRLSPALYKTAYQHYAIQTNDAISMRVTATFWILGYDVISSNAWYLLGLLMLCALIAGRPRAWVAALFATLRRLGPFWYVLLFSAVNAFVSVTLYPTQLKYAMTSWWLVEGEIIIVVLASVFVGTALAHIARSLVSEQHRSRLLVVALLPLVLIHGWVMYDSYWGRDIKYPTWNDDSYLAAQWLNENTPDDAVIGSWNAGVLAYYTDRTVINLDGLVNNEELIPYLESGRIGDYIREKGIDYVSDMEPQLEKVGAKEQLTLEQLYSRVSRYGPEYRIYKVDGDE